MIGACLIFRDSATYLDEWFAWHVHHGIRRFWLYDNDSVDDWRAVVDSWREFAGIETYSWPGRERQLEAYRHCLERARGRVEWLAFLDDDEFLQPASPRETLEALLGEYVNYAGVAVPWMVYGSAGHPWRMPGWVTERFTYRAPDPDPHVKCIVRPDRILAPLVSGHQFRPMGGQIIVDENYRPMTSPWAEQPSTTVFRINHYLVKSWEEYRQRRLERPTVDGHTPHGESSWREWDVRWSMTHDPSPLREIDAIRALSQRAAAGGSAVSTLPVPPSSPH
jgi:hypothetical protein